MTWWTVKQSFECYQGCTNYQCFQKESMESLLTMQILVTQSILLNLLAVDALWMSKVGGWVDVLNFSDIKMSGLILLLVEWLAPSIDFNWWVLYCWIGDTTGCDPRVSSRWSAGCITNAVVVISDITRMIHCWNHWWTQGTNSRSVGLSRPCHQAVEPARYQISW